MYSPYKLSLCDWYVKQKNLNKMCKQTKQLHLNTRYKVPYFDGTQTHKVVMDVECNCVANKTCTHTHYTTSFKEDERNVERQIPN